MKKIIDKKLIYINASIFLLGIIAGIVFLILTGNLDKLIIKNEITDFFEILQNGSESNLTRLLTSFKYNISYILLITVTSIVYIFSPLILFINFYKGLLIGFLISSVIMTFKLKGILYSILLIFPHHILMPITIILYSSIMLHFSIKLFKSTCKNENINLLTFIKKIGILLITATILSLISSILEIYLCPLIIKLFI